MAALKIAGPVTEADAYRALGVTYSTKVYGRCRACDRIYVWDRRRLGGLGLVCPIHGVTLARTSSLAVRRGTAQFFTLEGAA